MKKSAVLLSALVVMSGSALQADHGRGLMLVQDTEVPAQWRGQLWSNQSWERYGSFDEIAAEPGFIFGLNRWVALGAQVRFADEEDGWAYSSVAPQIQLSLTPSDWKVRMGVLCGYTWAEEKNDVTEEEIYEEIVVEEVSRSSAAPVASPATAPVSEPALPVEEEPVPCGPEYGPDAPPCAVAPTPVKSRPVGARHAGHSGSENEEPPAASPPSSSSAAAGNKSTTTRQKKRVVKKTVKKSSEERPTGIHLHGQEHFFARWMIEGDLTVRDTLFFNLIYVNPRDGDDAWGYAVGYRHTFSSEWAAGVEATGDFGEANEHRALAGVYWRPQHHWLLKIGAGAGLSDESADAFGQMGVAWSF
jgi:opacity protein-like surface antigen